MDDDIFITKLNTFVDKSTPKLIYKRKLYRYFLSLFGSIASELTLGGIERLRLKAKYRVRIINRLSIEPLRP
jgi:hypothetical protein